MAGGRRRRRATRVRAVALALVVTALVGGELAVVPTPSGAATPAQAGGPLEAPRASTRDETVPALPGGNLHPVVPFRVLDTRDGTGGFNRPVGAGRSIAVKVLGRGPIPASGVTAVVLNVTATAPTSSGFVTIWPTGLARPTASNLNVVPGVTVPNLVQVKVGAGGKVSAFNSAGSTHLIFDVTGWIGPTGEAGTAGLFHPIVPSRVLDTRDGTGAPRAKVGARRTVALQVTGRGGVPAKGVAAVALNVTVTEPTAPTFVTAYPSGSGRPNASNLNAVAGQTVPNRVVVKVGPTGKVMLYNNSGSLHLIADVGGWYTDGTDPQAIGGRFVGIAPVRVLDTRAAAGPVPNQATVKTKIAGANGIPGIGTQVPGTAVVANLTVTETRGAGFLTAFPSQAPRPLASDVNFVAGQTVPNLIITKLGPDGRLSVFDAAVPGGVELIIDVLGYYAGDVVISEHAEVLQPADLAKLTTTVGSTSTTMKFDPVPPSLADVEVGDTIIGGISPKSPNGVLKRVLETTTSGGGLTLTVENGTLSDVVILGDLAGTAALDSTTAQDPAIGTSATSVAPEASDVNAGVKFSHAVGVDITKKLGPQQGTHALEVTGSAKFEAAATLEAKLRCCVKVASAHAGLSFSKDLSLSVTGRLPLQVEDTSRIKTFPFSPLVFALGPVPVVARPTLTLDLKITAGITGSLKATLKKATTIRAGIRYREGEWDPYSEHTDDPASWTGPTATVEGSVKAEIEPNLALLLFGVAGPAFTPALYGKVAVSSENFDECLKLAIERGLTLKGKFILIVFGKNLGEFSGTLKQVSSIVFEKAIGDCGDGAWIGKMTITRHDDNADVDVEVRRHADGKLTWSGSFHYRMGGVCLNVPGIHVHIYGGYTLDGDGTLTKTPVTDKEIPSLVNRTYSAMGNDLTISDPPVLGPPARNLWEPERYRIHAYAPVEARYTTACGSGITVVDILSYDRCWPRGVADPDTTWITGTGQSDDGYTAEWEFEWTGSGPPKSGPEPPSTKPC